MKVRTLRPSIGLAWVVLVLVGCATQQLRSPSEEPGSPVIHASASDSSQPSPPPAAEGVDGLHSYTVSELQTARADSKVNGGPIALRGFWSDRSFGHSCSPPHKQPGDLELRCSDGEWGITEDDEAIGVLTAASQWIPARSPHLSPYVSNDLFGPLLQQVLINGQRELPVPIVVVGHFDDPRAKDCQPEAAKLCVDRFVIDRIVDYHPEAVPSPGVTPPPTPFPFDSPPPPPFDVVDCAGERPYSFVGWMSRADLGIDRGDVPATAYVAITRDVIEIGGWVDDPDGSNGRFRTMARRICFAGEDRPGAIGYSWVPGSEYREWTDGHRSPMSPPPIP
jgi:hypothetical protein